VRIIFKNYKIMSRSPLSYSAIIPVSRDSN